jgi:hypothetical protein
VWGIANRWRWQWITPGEETRRRLAESFGPAGGAALLHNVSPEEVHEIVAEACN